MEYSLEVAEVKKVIDAVRDGKPYDKEQFMFYHRNRNHFNVGAEVTSLTALGGGKYRDNLGQVWEEQSTFKNFFHMGKANWLGSIVGLSSPESKKFLRDDNTSGLGGEFEMIVRMSDGKRIDALTNASYQETYNFGRTRQTGAHKTLDVDPHNQDPNYTVKVNTGTVVFASQNP
ncbi:MAG: hypothetical protein MUC97_04330 [Bernardetiaceae bacterium]|jgi:hypothetical protein|nr:hypothetical protein [Bernardetiaceae bacterium]